MREPTRRRTVVRGIIVCVVLICLAVAACLALINRQVCRKELRRAEVEVAPDTFIQYEEYVVLWELKYKSFSAVHLLPTAKEKFYQKDTRYLRLPWKGQDILWAGCGIPVSIRAHDDELYMITFDRETHPYDARFRYYKHAYNTFSEIEANEYPKEIAIQNLWLHRYSGAGADLDQVVLARQLDPDNSWFRCSFTASIWYQLETGKEYYETEDTSIDRDFLAKYIEEYKPQKLTRIVRE